jgi:hypothetical protein
MPESYQCHPRVTGRKKGEGCLPSEVYSRIAGGGARAARDSHFRGPGKIASGGGSGSTLREIKQLGKLAAAKLGCEKRDGTISDLCILEKSGFSREEVDKIERQYLRPKMPKDWKGGRSAWLDTLNIENVLKQYEEVRPDFKFIGAIPIDFSAPDPYAEGAEKGKKCLYDETCKMNLDNLRSNGKKYVGFVFNLDPHFKNGSHWVSMILDLVKRECNFFDSYGYEPHPLIARLMKSFKIQDPNMKLNYNARRFQFGESECGMYCIYFITTMMNGENFKKFVKVGIPDAEMIKLREYVFAN